MTRTVNLRVRDRRIQLELVMQAGLEALDVCTVLFVLFETSVTSGDIICL